MAKALAVPHPTATPYRPQSNGEIERDIGITAQGTRVLLNQSGLQHIFWPYAARFHCLARNISKQTGEIATAWFRKCGAEFHARWWPFGGKVNFKMPKPLRKALKFDKDGEAGIFMGYFLQPGGVWNGDFLVVRASDFLTDKKIHVHRIKEVVFPEVVEFPMREAEDQQ